MFKVMTVVGARPQFIKAAALSNALKDLTEVQEIMLHTGQHFDENMSEIFFKQLGIPKPDIMLNINGTSHGAMTGRMIEGVEAAIIKYEPNAILLYGDTNSTLAGAIAASKLHIPVFHIEAGLRSGNMRMPEEINRILTDQVSDTLYCPTQAAVNNLQRENIIRTRPCRVKLVGDVMQDASIIFKKFALKPKEVPDNLKFCLCTIHRAENTDDPIKLRAIFNALNLIHAEHYKVVMPLHPRTKALLDKYSINANILLIEPTSYFGMLWLLEHCELVLTDSGGLQKEAYFFNKMCLTVREQTEWTELLDVGCNILTDSTTEDILSNFKLIVETKFNIEGELYGGGNASTIIANDILSRLKEISSEA